ncbi:MAG TPA: hypothetical protein VJB08_02085 [Candidatus Nanoarchaeia archaeon]|nr:hypothetical protein [Candidatus Nanoarchaeia archaeon]
MLIIKDTMVLIHLAKLSVLEKSCDYFKNVLIPESVYEEVLKGSNKQYADVPIITGIIRNKKMKIMGIKGNILVKKANQFNLRGGEADAVALYWQQKADILATDDDNVRKKRELLGIAVTGTPGILLTLYKEKRIDRTKMRNSIAELKNIGWFSTIVLDKMLQEAENG